MVARARRGAVVASVQDSIDRRSRVVEDTGPRASRNRAADRDAARRNRRAPVRRCVRRRPPRRGAGPRQGACVQPPRRVRSVGPEEPAARALGALQQPPSPGRAPAHLPAVELDRARHLAVHRRARRSSCPALYFAHRPRRLPSRRHVDGRQPVPRDARRRGVVREHGALPHDRRRHVHRGRRVRRPSRSTTSSPRRPSPASPSAAPPAPTTDLAKRAWKTASAQGYF